MDFYKNLNVLFSRFLVNKQQLAELNSFQRIANLYRQIQVFTILSNQCFQICLWPFIQFVSGSMVISVFYGLLIFHNRMPLLVSASLCVMVLAMMILCCSMLDLWSQLVFITSKILPAGKNSNDCKWSRRFVKSCPEIATKVGNFHKMDRERVPAFIRFILQRTFYWF